MAEELVEARALLREAVERFWAGWPEEMRAGYRRGLFYPGSWVERAEKLLTGRARRG